MAWTAGIFLRLVIAAVATAAAAAVVPPCSSQLAVAQTVLPKSVHSGRQVSLATRIHNMGTTAVTGVGVRFDLPVGVVPSSKKSSKGMVVVRDGGTSNVYWVGLTVKPGRRPVLKLRARICATAPPGQYPVSGAIYRVNTTNDVHCLTPLAASITVCPARGA